MTSHTLKPASEFPISQIAELLTQGFEGYFVPINITVPVLLTMLRRDGIDLNESRILHTDDKPIGVALIARRGWSSRLAAMGIVPDARGDGAGTWAMQHLVEEARFRADRELLLEVIEQNTAGVKLYQKAGFKILRRLVGYKLETPWVESDDELEEIDIREVARMIATYGSRDLPWQLSAETIAHHTLPSRAFRLKDSYCVISNPDVEHISISAVVDHAGSTPSAPADRLLHAVFQRFANRTWHVSPIYPEEMSTFFEGLGMQPETLSQYQMALTL